MSPRPLVEAVPGHERADIRASGSVYEPNIPALKALAIRSLASLFEREENLFHRRASLVAGELRKDRTSRKQTIIALLGLHRLAESGGSHPFDVSSIRDAVLADTNWVGSVGDLGLLTWFTAKCVPERLGKLFNEFDFETALRTYSDGRQGRTEGLAWFLAGIAHARLACPGTLLELNDIAVDTYHLLQNNQSEGGIFGHAAPSGIFRRIYCDRFGTFADQIHTIYALTAFARAFQVEEPLASALSCANSVLALQGEMGQWWFLYDKRAGRVVSRYPVCSSHQDGTAPLALLALGEATGQSFQEPVYRGLSWVAGLNELETDLRDADRGVIWDEIGQRSRALPYREAALNFLKISPGAQFKGLRVRYEVRPDHFGWLLYAFGGIGVPKVTLAAKAASTR